MADETTNEPTVSGLLMQALEQLTTDVGHPFDDPHFEDAGLCHDWRNHVLEEVIEVWDQLSLEARAVAYLQAANEARKEEWE